MGEKLNEYPYTKLTRAFNSSDVEAFKALIHDPTDPITPETATRFMYLTTLFPEKKEFVHALYQAGRTIDFISLHTYINNVSTHPLWGGFMDYDSETFQNALDHLHPRGPDVIRQLLECGTGENNDQTMRVFRFAKQENYVSDSRGYGPFEDYLELHCHKNFVGDRINTPEEHIDILIQAGIDVAEYPHLLSDALMYGKPGIPRALVNAGIPLSAAYDEAPPEYLDNQWYLDAIAREFPED
jgi:hypothetical protein